MKSVFTVLILIAQITLFGCRQTQPYKDNPKVLSPIFFNQSPTQSENVSDLFRDFYLWKKDTAKTIFLTKEPIPFNNVGNFLKDSTDLKPFEIKHIIDQSIYLSKINFDQNISNRIVLIPPAIKENIFRKKDWDHFHKTYGPYFLSISHPVFLRENTYCILYLNYFCDNRCGEEQIRFYKKDNGKWILIKTGHGWIS